MIKEKSIFAFLEEVKPLNILLIDDDMASQFIIAKNLHHLGDKLDICSSSEDAMERVSSYNYDLILVDLNLPAVNGFELSKSLKLLSVSNSTPLKIIGLSGLDHPLLPTLISNSDVDDYIIRSFDYSDLKSKIVNHCYLHQN
ncbi:MAG: response regulator [Cyclobacteriaceae bacterium]|nr:response regulator [Cyclobacteriaceae bacterium]